MIYDHMMPKVHRIEPACEIGDPLRITNRQTECILM
jgi:hypothetical protein